MFVVWCPVAEPESTGTKPKHTKKITPLDIKEILFNWERDQALAEVAQRGYGISYPGDIQKSSGHGCMTTDGPAWAGALDHLSSQGPFQMEPLCDSFGMGLHEKK